MSATQRSIRESSRLKDFNASQGKPAEAPVTPSRRRPGEGEPSEPQLLPLQRDGGHSRLRGAHAMEAKARGYCGLLWAGLPRVNGNREDTLLYILLQLTQHIQVVGNKICVFRLSQSFYAPPPPFFLMYVLFYTFSKFLRDSRYAFPKFYLHDFNC